jgi:UDP-N-acetylmuramoylalanine--D-glutamate ligase
MGCGFVSTSLDDLGRLDDWSGVRVVVAGMGVSGFAAADNLTHLGAQVTALDESTAGDRPEKARLLEMLGARVTLGEGSTSRLPDDVDLVITSPGWTPDAPLLAQARDRGVPIWGEVELAWRLRHPDHPAPWLAVTGTNGKTTTVQMLERILQTAGLRAVACGNVGLPIVEAVMDPEPWDVLAVELSSFQLHYTESMQAQSAAILNVAEDHLDWYDSMSDYIADKARIYRGVQRACVYNSADPVTEELVREADVTDGARAIGFTLGTPGVGMVGLVENVLADRAFIEERQTTAAEICLLDELTNQAPHFVSNALAAAALALSHGVPHAAVKAALTSFRSDGHRIERVANVSGVEFIDDSKATNPHAAAASLNAYDSVVWIAGGLAKGAHFDDLVKATRDRLRGVVLLGRDAEVIRAALQRHAPDVRVLEASSSETGASETSTIMDDVVRAAMEVAQDGDTVLLAPGCASMDMFANYGERGDAFAAAVRRLLESQE